MALCLSDPSKKKGKVKVSSPLQNVASDDELNDMDLLMEISHDDGRTETDQFNFPVGSILKINYCIKGHTSNVCNLCLLVE